MSMSMSMSVCPVVLLWLVMKSCVRKVFQMDTVAMFAFCNVNICVYKPSVRILLRSHSFVNIENQKINQLQWQKRSSQVLKWCKYCDDRIHSSIHHLSIHCTKTENLLILWICIREYIYVLYTHLQDYWRSSRRFLGHCCQRSMFAFDSRQWIFCILRMKAPG